jgi:cysteinyl-tRNA synthetase
VEDTNGLGLGRPDREPKASKTIPQIVALIEELIAGDHAYAAGGDVYFRVSSFADYGKLSGRYGDEDAMHNPSEEEERGELKEDPRDFALWKAHKEGEDTWWDSPWGRGRPGWHIECSAMAEAFLGRAFEIHGGGLDLVFPHHENEIAQSRAAGREFARIWMHNGMLRLAGEKMSKSIGNIVSLREALERWGREAVLVYFLGGQWSKPLDFSPEVMEQASARADSFREVFRNPHVPAPSGAWGDFASALEDDFSTPAALAVLHEWRDHDLLRRALSVFGLESLAEKDAAPADVVELAERRQAARAARDFDEADRLREELEHAGWEARDEPGGYRLVRIS